MLHVRALLRFNICAYRPQWPPENPGKGDYLFDAAFLLVSAKTETKQMSQECAFCPSTADLTGEHLWSQWMDDLFPGKKRFTTKNEKGEIIRQWEEAALRWKGCVLPM